MTVRIPSCRQHCCLLLLRHQPRSVWQKARPKRPPPHPGVWPSHALRPHFGKPMHRHRGSRFRSFPIRRSSPGLPPIRRSASHSRGGTRCTPSSHPPQQRCTLAHPPGCLLRPHHLAALPSSHTTCALLILTSFLSSSSSGTGGMGWRIARQWGHLSAVLATIAFSITARSARRFRCGQRAALDAGHTLEQRRHVCNLPFQQQAAMKARQLRWRRCLIDGGRPTCHRYLLQPPKC